MLASALDVPHHAWHDLSDVDTSRLTGGFVLQIHQRWSSSFSDWLAGYGFRILTIARHPFDVLISVLHFCRHDTSCDRWLNGRGGTESAIRHASPWSPEFLDYATGPRAAELLAAGTDWWDMPDVVRTRYEAFVDDPETELGRVARTFGDCRTDVREIVRRHAIDLLRPRVNNHHFWQGRPGLWRSLLTATEVNDLVRAHGRTLALYGYSAQADAVLTPEAADRNWHLIAAPAPRRAA